MKVALGSDKSGFILKEAIKQYLTDSGIQFDDLGTTDINMPQDISPWPRSWPARSRRANMIEPSLSAEQVPA